MSIGEPGNPKKDTPAPPTVTSTVSQTAVVPADSAVRAGSDNDCGNVSVCSASRNALALLGLEVKVWEQGGVQIVKIMPDGAASLAGLHVEEVINSVDGKQVQNAADLEQILGNGSRGRTIRVGYLFHTNLGWMPGAGTIDLQLGCMLFYTFHKPSQRNTDGFTPLLTPHTCLTQSLYLPCPSKVNSAECIACLSPVSRRNAAHFSLQVWL
jgi:hypothetical protein